MIHLGIIEDEPLVRDNLITYLGDQVNIEVDIATDSVEDFLLDFQEDSAVNMILLDINLPGMSGMEGIRHIKARKKQVEILMLTAYDDSERIFKSLCAGAVSYLSKRSDLHTIKDALETVFRGGAYMSPSIARKVVDHFAPKQQAPEDVLTPRQQQIVEGLVEGLSYKMIADKYLISVETVRDHIKKIYKKLQVNSKAEVIKKKMDGEI